MKISFIGTGYMGAPMAEKLIEAGNDVAVFNRTVEKAKPLENKGAKVLEQFTDAVDYGDAVIFMLSDYSAITSLIGESGYSGFNGKTIIQMSTIAPGESLALKRDIENSGGVYLEAPVLGSIPQIKSKSLIVLVGSSDKQFEGYKDLFKAFSDDVRYIGEVSKAAAIKLALNQLIVGVTSVFSMSLGFVRENEIDVEQFMDIVRKSALYAPTYDKKLNNYMNDDFSDPNFPLKHLLKDLNLIIDAFLDKQINIETLKGIKKVLEDGLHEGLGELDYSALYKVIHKNLK